MTGIAGNNCAAALLEAGHRVVGLSRRVNRRVHGVEHVTADVLDRTQIKDAVAGQGITDLVFATWRRHDTEAENCRVNAAMLRNTLEAVGSTTQLRHVTLVTGLKHYLGPFEAYGKTPAETPYRE
ncbi:NAD(P)H-binding protein [Micromonospora sp. WMMD558]|uniref:NAD(P)H-binding protein n=1 Tax=Micromonospora sp. WMMD558 TaxID=3403462 RepID=UPI003BF4AE12